jgi:hypothetical protein
MLAEEARRLIAQDGAVSEKFREGLAQLNLRPEQILKLDDALTRLEGLNARQVSLLELRNGDDPDASVTLNT